jgi:hypothetical protein
VAAGVLAVTGVATAIVLQVANEPSQLAQPQEPNGQVVPLDAGYAYDVTDLEVVMANTDTVFVGKVSGVDGVDETTQMTEYQVEPTQVLEGSDLGDAIKVRQLGYIDGGGVSHIIEGQALLKPGETYMFAASHEAELYTIPPGPHSAKLITSAEQKDDLVRTYSAVGAN